MARAESITILGDDLYSRQPFCRQLLSHGYHFILVCKPESHKTLYEYVKCLGDDLDEAIWEEWKGPKKVISRYRFANELPIKDGKDALKVNWCEIVEAVEGKGITYKNSFITDHQLTPKNVAAIVEDGRPRWKVHVPLSSVFGRNEKYTVHCLRYTVPNEKYTVLFLKYTGEMKSTRSPEESTRSIVFGTRSPMKSTRSSVFGTREE